MYISFVSIAPRQPDASLEELVNGYLQRFGFQVQASTDRYRSEGDYLAVLRRDARRQSSMLVVLERGGRQMSSEDFAAWLRDQRDAGRQHLSFAVGPASGWTTEMHERAGMLLSLGPMTLQHELARLIIVEQVYRAFTILAGHPYHSGH